jgi:capsule polysaccharide export protein KpsE/RkpR
VERVLAGWLAKETGQVLGRLLPRIERNRDIFIAMLKSRTIAEDLVDRFNLKEHYKVAFVEDAANAVQAATEIKVSKEGAISITVQDRNPRLAADIANAYITLLDRHSAILPGTGDADRQRAILADELEKSEKALREAQRAPRAFEENNDGIAVQGQRKTAALKAAELKGKIIANEAQLEIIRLDRRGSNPHLFAQEQLLEKMKRQLAKIQETYGMEVPSKSDNPIGFDREVHASPVKAAKQEDGSEYLRLVGEIRTRETAYRLLTEQYEQARISESGELPWFLVLDKAVPAERKSRPKTTQNIAIAGALSLFVGIFLAFFLEYLSRIRQQQAQRP